MCHVLVYCILDNLHGILVLFFLFQIIHDVTDLGMATYEWRRHYLPLNSFSFNFTCSGRLCFVSRVEMNPIISYRSR